jgi:hypothetical protein
MKENGVSETVGVIVLVAIATLAVGIVLVILLAGPLPTNVPAFSGIITNSSNTIYIRHLGGDPLYSGQYNITVDGFDRTSSFVGPNPFTVGTNLSYTSPTMPSRVVMVFNTPMGGGTVLLSATLLPNAGPGCNPKNLPTFVQIGNTSTAAGTNPQTLALPVASTPGDLIVVTTDWGSQTINIVNITDSMLNTYQLAAGPITAYNVSRGAYDTAVTYYASNIAAGGSPITISVRLTASPPADPAFEIYAAEYSNMTPVRPLDQASSQTGLGLAENSGSGTTTQSCELIYGWGWSWSNSDPNPPYTLRSNFRGNMIADQVVSSLGAYSVTATNEANTNWICQMSTFKGR